MSTLGRWVIWRPSEGPCPLPRRAGKKVVLFDEDVFDPETSGRPDTLLPAGPVYVVPTRYPGVLRRVMRGTAPARCIPALLVETQADIDDVARVREMVQTKAEYRALVVSPLEPLNLALFGLAPSAWGLGYRPFLELFHLVIVRGPEIGALNPSVVRDLRDQAADAQVAFTFLNWGSAARTSPELDGRRHDAMPWEKP